MRAARICPPKDSLEGIRHGGFHGTWTFTMPEANVWVVVTYTKDVQNAWIQSIADQTYTGEALTSN